MDCKTARSLLDFVRPWFTDLSPEDVEALQEHLDECSDCGPAARWQRQADERLGRAMRSVRLPPDLRTQLLKTLAAKRAGWYRSLPRRYPGMAAAIAATILVLLGLGVYRATKGKPVLDLDVVLVDYIELDERRGGGPEQVEQWFADRGFRTKVPPDFNYRLLASFAQESFQGQLVPRLLFVRGQDQAYVYVLSASQFDLPRSLPQRPQGSGRYTVELKGHLDHPDIAFLILYTGDSLEAFLDAERRPTT